MNLIIKNINAEISPALENKIRKRFNSSWLSNWALKKTEIYLYQKNETCKTIGIACNTGRELYFNNAPGLDFEEAFYNALGKMENQLAGAQIN